MLQSLHYPCCFFLGSGLSMTSSTGPSVTDICHQGWTERRIPCLDLLASALPPAAQEAIGHLCHEGTLPAYGQHVIHQDSQGLSSRAAFQMISPKRAWVSCQSISPVYRGPSGWQHDSVAYQTHLSILYPTQFCWGYTVPYCPGH